MTRVRDQNASTKATIVGVQTITFSQSDLPSTGLVALHFRFTGAGMTFGDIDRVRIKAAGSTIYDLNRAMLAAFLQRFRQSNFAPVAADVAFTVPFHLLDTLDEDYADQIQFPRGAAITAEIVTGAGAAVGTCQAGWTLTNVDPKGFPVLLGSQMQVSAIGPNNRYNFDEPGVMRGFGINTVGLSRVRVVLSGQQFVNIEGTQLLLESEQDMNVQTATDPVFAKLVGAVPAVQGSSFVEFDTAAGWVGATNEWTTYAIRPQ